jgi:hypothetical protein
MVLRLAVAVGLGVAALRIRWLAVIAATIAYPVVWINSLSTLVALVNREVRRR